ncbi:hypothetical protein NEMIN01_1808 [Nematocida minor]|uniref:uncharacterized protein n=1 Tax=Nematocida minor TaxID=1912983 RepID=UPI00221F91B5|nr:uncharacterized protein NEMIN01_1808 [Nematocida minor]KAI5192060.1 hypothetical protein NEMIN01_1808 [Nematocida minor]
MNLRFSVDTLRLLIEFKMSSDRFPDRHLMNLFCDLLPVDGVCCLLSFLAENSYEYFYSCRAADSPSKEEFSEWVRNWMQLSGARRLKVEVSRDKLKTPPEKEGVPAEESAPTYFVVVDSTEISKNSLSYKARKKLIHEIKEKQRLFQPEKKRVRVSVSEDILKCAKKEAAPEESTAPEPIKEKKSAPKSSLLSFITKKDEPHEESFRKTQMKVSGIFHGNTATIRHCKEIAKPIRMVFYQIHGQVRPPYYAVKTRTSKPNVCSSRRNSVKRMLPPEDYMYDSDEEWVEGDGESIDEDSIESDEEESEDAEWVEEDTNEIFFSKGQLPRMDHPLFTVLLVDETKME